VLLSSGLAEQLKLSVQDTIYIIGQGYHGAMAAGKYPIKGILTFGAPDLNNRLVYLPLALAQALYDTGNRATSLIVNIHDQENLLPTVEQLKRSLGGEFEVMRWQELMPEIEQHMKTDEVNMQIIQGILYVLIAFGIFGTITMMMVERRRELGMLVAIGMKKFNLICLFIIESVCTVITGCLMGIAISIPLVYYLKIHPIRLGGEFGKTYAKFGFEPILPGSVEANIFLTQGFIVLSMGLLLSLYPIYKIIRLNPVDAMKK
jgi:putative ABC transport system permease protein